MKNNKITFDFFNQIHNRKNTASVKYDIIPQGANEDELIPMWVADMDFKTPPAVEKALTETAQKGIYGYTMADNEYKKALINWFAKRHNWHISYDWNTPTPGVMFAVSAAIRALTAPQDTVLICQPVYYPFANTIKANGRKTAVSELELINGHYEINFYDFEKQIKEKQVKLFILCSPHNPVGRVWTKDELYRIGKICLKHNVYVIADEIHADFVYSGYRHIPFASICPEFADITITCTSPSKTFNLAGLQVANILISNENIRNEFQKQCNITGYGNLSIMAYTATKTAYTQGEEWLNTMLKYLEQNIKILTNTLGGKESTVKLIKPEGTYLMWLDCKKLFLNREQPEKLFLQETNLWLNSGNTFGKGGEGFMRMNIACPKVIIETAVSRLKKII